MVSSEMSLSAVFGKLQNPFKLKVVTAVLDGREYCAVFAISCKQQGARDDCASND